MNGGRTIIVRAAIGGVLLAGAFLIDRSAFEPLRGAVLYDRWGEMREGLTAAKFLASGLGVVVIGVVVGLLDRYRWRRTLVLWLAVALAGGIAGAVKVASGRERPSHLDQPVGQERLAFHGPGQGRHAPFQSFPSGHTASAFAAATCLAAFYPPAQWVVYGVAAATGVNRVVKHQHFLSDVVAGALLGHLVALALLTRRRLALFARCRHVDRRQGAP